MGCCDLPWLAAALKALSKTKRGPTALDVTATEFRRIYKDAVQGVNCGDWGFMPYSLRRGGATDLWRKTGALSRVTLRGRWQHATTARVYVNDGLATFSGAEVAQRADEAVEQRLRKEDVYFD